MKNEIFSRLRKEDGNKLQYGLERERRTNTHRRLSKC